MVPVIFVFHFENSLAPYRNMSNYMHCLSNKLLTKGSSTMLVCIVPAESGSGFICHTLIFRLWPLLRGWSMAEPIIIGGFQLTVYCFHSLIGLLMTCFKPLQVIYSIRRILMQSGNGYCFAFHALISVGKGKLWKNGIYDSCMPSFFRY